MWFSGDTPEIEMVTGNVSSFGCYVVVFFKKLVTCF